jgi:hypothetical protein
LALFSAKSRRNQPVPVRNLCTINTLRPSPVNDD